MTTPNGPRPVLDLTDRQQALIVIAGLSLGLDTHERSTLLALALPGFPPDEREHRFNTVLDAVTRHSMLDTGELSPTAILGPPEADEDEDDRVHAARVTAWFEVTTAAMRAAPRVETTVDEHAAEIIAALCAPEQDGRVAA